MSTASVFETLAAEISALRGSPLVSIDGVDGSGKTIFAKSLTAQLNARPVIVIHVDDFLNPPEIRHRRGRQSPEGFWLDSYDYDALERHVLDSLGPGGSRRYRQRRVPACSRWSDSPCRRTLPASRRTRRTMGLFDLPRCALRGDRAANEPSRRNERGSGSSFDEQVCRRPTPLFCRRLPLDSSGPRHRQFEPRESRPCRNYHPLHVQRAVEVQSTGVRSDMLRVDERQEHLP